MKGDKQFWQDPALAHYSYKNKADHAMELPTQVSPAQTVSSGSDDKHIKPRPAFTREMTDGSLKGDLALGGGGSGGGVGVRSHEL